MDLVQKVIDIIYNNAPVHTWCPHCDSDVNRDIILSKDTDKLKWKVMAQKVIDTVLENINWKEFDSG